MRDFLQTLIGFGIIILMGYTLFVSILILTGNTDKTFGDISVQLVISLIFASIFMYEFIRSLRKKPTDKTSATSTVTTEVEKRTYNAIIDILSFDHYQQKSETWWSDSDGDTHSRDIEYASLRFYEDGTVIGKRDIAILKLEMEDSYVYKGTWSVLENKLKFHLEKVQDVDDTIFKYISAEEQRDMKYAGHITVDDDLIKDGFYTGTIKGDTIEVGSMVFSKVIPSRLILTASEDACEDLENEFKNHPLVIRSYTDSGNWYSNGEEGPEWHTVTFESRYELREELERDLKNSKVDFYNMHWG
ncbi:MAG: hypothetical protein RIB47_01555 [Cyclobacteriaceae bacterium]